MSLRPTTKSYSYSTLSYVCNLHLSAISFAILILQLTLTQSQDNSVSYFFTGDKSYKWVVQDWGQCAPLNKSVCRELRTVECHADQELVAIPPHYCKPISPPQKFRSCFPCPEDCVLSSWQAWSECSATCSPLGVRYRTREVMRPPFSGGNECEDLSEIEICPTLEDCGNITEPVFTWKLGEWTSCRQNVTSEEDDCGLGRRSRSSVCVDSNGKQVHQDGCLQSSGDSMPHIVEVCTLPCNCKLSDWMTWSPCSVTCRDVGEDFDGIQTRSREVEQLPENDGLPCAHIFEQRVCEIDVQGLPECPVFDWWTQEWQACAPSDPTKNCGSGHENRQVYCIKAGDANLQPVDAKHCDGIDKPITKKACFKDCPVNCELGEWQNWSPCSQSCNGGFHVRVRDVLVPPMHGGAPCDVQYQGKACDMVECAWWRIGRWSACYLDEGDCGYGSWIRSIYCLDARDSRVDQSKCADKPKPVNEEDCSTPCPDDCVVSEWSSWSECSKTCGKRGGVQIRKREILAYGSDPDVECIPQDELTQTQPCNLHTSCSTYMWQFSAWDECIQSGDRSCGNNTGTQMRNVTCEIDTGSPANESFCEPSTKPTITQSCDIPCPIDCQVTEWSEWSDCNQTCGSDGHQERSRIILRLAAHGGEACPLGANDEGVIIEYMPCLSLPLCYTYFWNPGVWSDCQVIADDCGQGLQVRNMECKRNDGQLVEPGVCLREVLETPPHTHQECFVPCGGDCELTSWTEFGPCRMDCGDVGHTGYCRKRSRRLAVDHSEDVVDLCPNLTSDDLLQYEPCDNTSYSFNAVSGNWSSCILPEGQTCGQGSKTRSVLCVRNDGMQVPGSFCVFPTKPLPPSQEACAVPCHMDCQVSDWLSWSECSEVCGHGNKTRTRNVIREQSTGGRGCPHLSETSICMKMSCDLLIWAVSEWQACIPVNPNTNCGRGYTGRNVTCPAGKDFESECQARQDKPVDQMNCTLPCTGDCVLSEWSEFTSCSAICGQGSKTRTREIVRDSSSTGAACGTMEESVGCGEEECPGFGHHILAGDWSECIPQNGNCGAGTKHRMVNCINNNTNLPMPMSNCLETSLTIGESCDIPCAINCEVGVFTSWSECSATCGGDGRQSRTRLILQEPLNGGRPCPETNEEIRPCGSKPCFTYKFTRGAWSECTFDSHPGCGVGLQTRRVECLRSDGRTMNWEYCLLPENKAIRYANEVFSELNTTGLDLVKEKTCEKPCPGDCVVTEWSDYTPCYGSCFDSYLPGIQSRSRQVVVKPSLDGVQCPDLVETKSCPSNVAVCPGFSWQTSEWDTKAGTREVWCQMKGFSNLNVTGGCISALEPPATLECVSECSKYGGFCIEGKCFCESGYVGDGVTCFPVSGCRLDDHCPMANTYCNKDKSCSCNEGFVLKLGKCEDVSNASSQAHGGGSIWLWLVIAVVIVAVVLVLICVIYCSTRSRKHGGFQPLPQTISSTQSSSFKMTKF